jgi:hypothetical protein
MVAVVAVWTVVLAAPGALAAKPDARACKAAKDSAVQLGSEKHLREAVDQLAICAASACPGDVKKDCTRMSGEVEAAIPTLLFSVKDPSGKDVTEVKVTMDGQPLVDTLDGSPIEVDPGVHTFTFTADPWAPATVKLDIGSGEKRRLERVTLARAGGAAVAPVPPPAAPPAPEPPQPPSTPPTQTDTVGIITGGLGFLGAVGLTLGGVYGMLAITSRDQQNADCASPTSCTNHPAALNDHSSALNDGTVSTVSFIVGGLFLAGAAGFYFGETGGFSSKSTGLLLVPSVLPGSGSLAVKGEF